MVLQRRRRIKPAADPGAHQASPWAFAGMVLMAASFFLYAASGLIAPWWAVVVLILGWLFQLVLCFAWWTPHPKRLPVVGVVSMVVWFFSLVGGAMAFGWSA